MQLQSETTKQQHTIFVAIASESLQPGGNEIANPEIKDDPIIATVQKAVEVVHAILEKQINRASTS